MNKRVLFVDDEENVLSSYRRLLRNRFIIVTTISAEEAIETIKSSEPFAAVVTDYKMPEMNGVQLLSIVSEIAPETVRILITGYADLHTAIEAVNEGKIFRFLSKPCPHEQLEATINTAIEQHRLITSEKELLEKTLKGSMKLLIDMLAISNPTLFSQANRIRLFARNIANRFGIQNTWDLEIASMLSQIGSIAIPSEIIEKKFKGIALSKEEIDIFQSIAITGHNLIKNIPRLEKAALIIRNIFKKNDSNEEDLLFSSILKVLIEYDFLVQSGKSQKEAINILYSYGIEYDVSVINVLETELKNLGEGFSIISVPFRKLRLGMMLAEDIIDEKGVPLITKGNEITDLSLMRLITISKSRVIREPIKILENVNK